MNLTNAQPGRYISSDSRCAEMPVKSRRPSCEVSCLFLCLKPENKLPTKHMVFAVGVYVRIHLFDLTWQIRKQPLSIRKYRTIVQDHLQRSLEESSSRANGYVSHVTIFQSMSSSHWLLD